ncbi:hypothetical protein ACQP25_30845 [Microtetraspora malaysiensis]|uniref:hypothetical protein n=1 Tax=Microtetraspora malaysiensis TaxID=161358 RepID=UPI003D928478
MDRRQPNARLQALINEAGFSNKGLARRVVDQGKQRGECALKYDHSSVIRWLKGQRPRPPVPQFIAEVFSARLGRPVSIEDLGMASSPVPGDVGLRLPHTPAIAADAVSVLSKSDLEQRRFLIEADFDLSAYSSAALRWLLAPRTSLPPGQGPRRIGMAEVQEIREATQAFRVLDNRLGGGRIRSTVVEYLHSDITPQLHHARCADQVRRELFSAAAELTHLAGWQAYDLELQGLAQRYMVQALAMASFAGDDALGGEILAAMSHQAVYVAKPDDAVDIAHAAQTAARRAGVAALLTECLVLEAHAHASLQQADTRACSQALHRAEAAFGQAGSADRPMWLSYFDHAYFAARIAHCFRALGQGAQMVRYAKQSLNMDQQYVRGKAFNTAILALGYAMSGEPTQACHHGREAVDLAAGLNSARVVTYMRDLLRNLEPYSGAAEVAELKRYVAHRLPRAAGRAGSR